MFDHVTIRVSDRGASERFYETVLATIGIAKTYTAEDFAEWNDFSLAQASAERPATRRLHVGFFAASHAEVDEFWRVGTEAGYRDDGAPGLRPEYREDYYGAFLLDPDGCLLTLIQRKGLVSEALAPASAEHSQRPGAGSIRSDAGSIPAASTPAFAGHLQHPIQASSDQATLVSNDWPLLGRARPSASAPDRSPAVSDSSGAARARTPIPTARPRP